MFGGAKPGEVRVEMGDMGGSNGDAAYYQDTEENAAFRQEFEDRKVKQDEVLDEIERGVGRMGDIATDMGQELQKQDRLLDEVEGQVRGFSLFVSCFCLVEVISRTWRGQVRAAPGCVCVHGALSRCPGAQAARRCCCFTFF